MLKLKSIVKDYPTGDMVVHALKGVDMDFRKSEFVSVLGQSGCGKTTLLNIIGGLDQYTDGDLIINGKSTKEFKNRDWDFYRNHSVGFIFQSYNLIPHQTVLSNVELALTLSGVSKSERRKRAIDVLTEVGLADQIHKKPNQMSGGQMQRVAIARALVNNPDILLADEPTGALDSETSVQIMELLKVIAKDRLVIMVTHNPELAEKYSSRIIRLLDGEVISDTNPYDSDSDKAETDKSKKKKTSMSFFTALSLSLNNLMTKKTRTFMTAFAGSIGIIGIALILSLSNGVEAYIQRVQEDTLSSYPIQIQHQTVDYTSLMANMMGTAHSENEHENDKIYSNDIMGDMIKTMMSEVKTNNLKDFKVFLDDPANGVKEHTTDIQYGYITPLNLYRADTDKGLTQVNPSKIMFDIYEQMGISMNIDSSSQTTTMSSMQMSSTNVFTPLLNNEELLKTQYDVVTGRMPESYNEVVLILSEDNEITDYALYTLGVKDIKELSDLVNRGMAGEKIVVDKSEGPMSITYDEFMELQFKLMVNTDYYEKQDGKWVDHTENNPYIINKLNNSETIKIVGIIKPSPDSVITSASGVLGYRTDLMEHLIGKVNESEIVKEQKANPNIDVFTGIEFNTKPLTEEEFMGAVNSLPEAEKKQALAGIEQMKASGMDISKIIEMFGSEMKISTKATYEGNLLRLGVSDLADPYTINIFPKDFEAKEAITEKIDKYNASATEEDKIEYTDYIGLLLSSVTTIINAVSYILIAFVAISLVVSSIMIGIITYISVLERTKEIGILRAIGASKKDISRVFNAETLIVGFTAGMIGIGITMLLNIPINIIVKHVTDIANLSKLPPVGGVILVVISMLLTFIAGLIPSRIAAKKDPVVALRSE